MNRKEKPVAKRERKPNKEDSDEKYLQEETVRAIFAVLFFVLGVFLLLSSGPIDKGGFVGRGAYNFLNYLFGIGYYILPVLFIILSSLGEYFYEYRHSTCDRYPVAAALLWR